MFFLCSYDTWLTDVEIDAESEPPLEPDGPWQVCVIDISVLNLIVTNTEVMLPCLLF